MQCICECRTRIFRIHYRGGVFIASCAGCDKVATEWKERQAAGSEPMEGPEGGTQDSICQEVESGESGETERVIGGLSPPRPSVLNDKHRMAFEKRREYMRNYMQKRRDKRKAERWSDEAISSMVDKLEAKEHIDGLAHPVNS